MGRGHREKEADSLLTAPANGKGQAGLQAAYNLPANSRFVPMRYNAAAALASSTCACMAVLSSSRCLTTAAGKSSEVSTCGIHSSQQPAHNLVALSVTFLRWDSSTLVPIC